MSESSQHAALAAYLQRLIEYLDAPHEVKPMSQADLDKLAVEMGLSAEDLAVLERKKAAHKMRAEGHWKAGNWDASIEEWSQLWELNPFDPATVKALGTAYFERWRKFRSQTDADSTLRLAEHLIQLAPEDPLGYEWMARLGRQSPQDSSAIVSDRPNWGKRLGIGAFTIALLLCLTHVFIPFEAETVTIPPHRKAPVTPDRSFITLDSEYEDLFIVSNPHGGQDSLFCYALAEYDTLNLYLDLHHGIQGSTDVRIPIQVHYFRGGMLFELVRAEESQADTWEKGFARLKLPIPAGTDHILLRADSAYTTRRHLGE
ncbi:hypothetical protein [Pontibacter sp. G13]|uniref:tetratricopeptide repeat protein n=1 Tax=Pontibacter sp. G13 TaxID=3074898 RepID=UPI00288A7F01|nr:hypothetical protein [Pontibacter sp. G13]WNJ16838.1 hypothetical protein RJD25_18395 [Pontibacter sp. G13]